MLHKTFGCVRFVYNWGSNEKAKTYAESQENISCFELTKQVTALKKEEEHEWLSEVHFTTASNVTSEFG